jgi:hypothetical protein
VRCSQERIRPAAETRANWPAKTKRIMISTDVVELFDSAAEAKGMTANACVAAA